ncbi:shikimate kinase [Flavobacterium quisquiliarum]|uniref:Shikimate kinase n=1 Tax=Flavobacterium quisquiliarum TaxID=1834436 RepID=A0ABV8WCL1_9FLAO|nr:shikimate kinase [Flavobacterium quisquiliarum]MBW1655302.1 adenylate kinase [Flavobacterium quisquiliarum]NWL00688.1 adenylate kinase [Flavobacterium collinsii]
MKIHIFGASGSGVTTTGKEIAQKLNLDYFDSDDYFWKNTEVPFTQRNSPEERNSKIKSDLNSSKNWVLGGSIFQWGEAIFPSFDLVIFLWIPADIRIERLKARELERYGDIIFTDPQRIKQFEDFLIWSADYDLNTGIANRTRQSHEEWLLSLDFPILRIIGDTTIEERIEIILQKISSLNLYIDN